MKKFLLGLLIFIVVILVVAVGGYLGVVPGVSSLFGANKPKNLGVTFTSQDLTSAEAKAGTQIVTLAPNLPPSQSISFSGQKNVNTTFTQSEFNAWMNNSWDDALLGCQLKISSDGTASRIEPVKPFMVTRPVLLPIVVLAEPAALMPMVPSNVKVLVPKPMAVVPVPEVLIVVLPKTLTFVPLMATVPPFKVALSVALPMSVVPSPAVGLMTVTP